MTGFARKVMGVYELRWGGIGAAPDRATCYRIVRHGRPMMLEGILPTTAAGPS